MSESMHVDFSQDSNIPVANSGCAAEVTVIPGKLMDNSTGGCQDVKPERSLRRRSGIYYGVFDCSSDEESIYEQYTKELPKKRSRQKDDTPRSISKPKYEKELSRWNPKAACRPVIDDAPVFYPTEEDFKDPLGYIASIRDKAEKYGICRIIPPHSWSPSCPLKEEKLWGYAKFTTRVQEVDKLQNRVPMRKRSRNRCHKKRKRRNRIRFGMTRRRSTCAVSETSESVGSDTDEKFGFQSGSEFTLETFEKYADEFKREYFGMDDADEKIDLQDDKCQKSWQPSVEDVEGEYWRIVENPNDEIEVHYGADLDTGSFGSGFPKASSENKIELDPYVLSGWNLNNLPRLPGSILSFEKEDISGVLVPWLYIGMCFSSFCWHVEDHHLYSLNYMHFGEPKIWYGVPCSDAVKLEDAMRKHLPELFEEQPDLLHELVTQLSPSVLKAEGVNVYRAIQNAGEFVLTFPRAYHSGFNCGFNCAEAVNVAPVDWLPHGQCAVELYGQQHRKTSLSHDKLLLGVSMESVKEQLAQSDQQSNSLRFKWQKFCGKDGILTEAIKARVAMERERRGSVSCISNMRNIDKVFDVLTDRECFFCFYDLHLSAAGCECSPNRYACLSHADLLCFCEPCKKHLFFRYSLDELDSLVASVGDTSAVDLSGLKGTGFCEHKQLKALGAPRDSFNCSSEPERLLIDVNAADTDTCAIHNHYDDGEVSKGFFLEQLEIKSSRILRVPEQMHGSNDPIKLGYTDAAEIGVSNRQPNVEENNANTNFGAETLVRKSDQVSHYDIGCQSSLSTKPGTLLLSSNGDEGKHFCLDLNIEQSNIEPKYDAENSSDQYNKVVGCAVNEEQDCHSDMNRKRCSFNFRFMGFNCHGMNRNYAEYDFMRKNKDIIKTSADYGFSTSPSQVDFGSSGAFPEEKLSQTLCSKDSEYPRKSSPKIFGVELQQHFYDSATCSESPSNQTVKKYSKSYSELYQNVHDIREIRGVPKFCVEPINFGKVKHGKQWCNRQAIFPNGFRTRVRYLSVLDPTKLCNYVSEVLDGRNLGPSFKVIVEDNPDVSFASSSASECWEMVRQRLNQEIVRQRSSCKKGLPELQTPGSMDGLEMFGFLSPSIIRVIEALDPFHECSEYWESKFSSPSVSDVKNVSEEITRTCDTHIGTSSSNSKSRKLIGSELTKVEMHGSYNDSDDESVEVQKILRGLFKKANPEELRMLQKIFSGKSGSRTWEAAYNLLLDEIPKTVNR